MFIENTLVAEITLSSVKTIAAIFRAKFGVNQLDKVLRTVIGIKTERIISK